MMTTIQEPTYSNRELLLERDELLLRLAGERQRNSDLQQHVNALEGAAVEQARRGDIDVEFVCFIMNYTLIWHENMPEKLYPHGWVKSAIRAWEAREAGD
jgi:hypothetical protein